MPAWAVPYPPIGGDMPGPGRVRTAAERAVTRQGATLLVQEAATEAFRRALHMPIRGHRQVTTASSPACVRDGLQDECTV